MKKFLSLFAVAALVLPVVTGCGEEKKKEVKKAVVEGAKKTGEAAKEGAGKVIEAAKTPEKAPEKAAE